MWKPAVRCLLLSRPLAEGAEEVRKELRVSAPPRQERAYGRIRDRLFYCVLLGKRLQYCPNEVMNHQVEP